MRRNREKELFDRLTRIESRAARLLAELLVLLNPAMDDETVSEDSKGLKHCLRIKAIALELKRDATRLNSAVLRAIESNKR